MSFRCAEINFPKGEGKGYPRGKGRARLQSRYGKALTSRAFPHGVSLFLGPRFCSVGGWSGRLEGGLSIVDHAFFGAVGDILGQD